MDWRAKIHGKEGLVTFLDGCLNYHGRGDLKVQYGSRLPFQAIYRLIKDYDGKEKYNRKMIDFLTFKKLYIDRYTNYILLYWEQWLFPFWMWGGVKANLQEENFQIFRIRGR